MTGTRPILSVLALALLTGVAAAGPFSRSKPRADAAKAKQLVDALRTDPDEARRRAAAADLGDHDPKGDADVLAALIGALQRDPSAGVREAVVDTLGAIKPYSPQGGLALERAAESDRSAKVREAARQGLWEYHLNGYRSQKIAEMVTFQTAEPPLARRAAVRYLAPPVAPPTIVRTPLAPKPPPAVAPAPPARATAEPPMVGGRSAVRPMPVATGEPPFARPPAVVPDRPANEPTLPTIPLVNAPTLPAAMPARP